jgi:Spy/CpxP family protein refolding chaperone
VRASRALARIVLVAALFAAALPAVAQPDIPDGKWWKRPRLAALIGLSPDQQREIEKIFVRSRTRLIDLRADLEKKQVALQSSMEDQGVERRAVERQIEAVENARAELQKARALMILDMKQVLKPEQWERLLRMQQAIRERRQLQKEGRPEGYGEDPNPPRSKNR